MALNWFDTHNNNTKKEMCMLWLKWALDATLALASTSTIISQCLHHLEEQPKWMTCLRAYQSLTWHADSLWTFERPSSCFSLPLNMPLPVSSASERAHPNSQDLICWILWVSVFMIWLAFLSDSAGLKKRWGSARDGGEGAPRIKTKVRDRKLRGD